MKYSSEGIPFPPEMGMDEDEENFLFYESIAWKQGKKILEGKLNKKTGILELFENNISDKIIDFSLIKNTIDKENIQLLNDNKNDIMKILNQFSLPQSIQSLSIATCYVHYRFFMSQWKINPN